MEINKYLGLILLFCVTSVAYARQDEKGCIVKGWVKDTVSLKAIAYATVQVAEAEHRTIPVKLTVTDTNGFFKVGPLAVGKYVLTFSHVGYRGVVWEFRVEAGRDEMSVGTLYMVASAERLQEVDVVARKLPIRFEVDKITYDVGDDPDAKNESVLEVLRKVPLVTVDGMDGIELNGRKCSIYINGRPSGLVKQQPGKGLKGIPAVAVKKIEVITDPGAKYDASEVGGIINIEMARMGLEGYSLYVVGGGDDYGTWNVAANGMLKYGKLSLSSFLSYYDVGARRSEYHNVLENLNDQEQRYLVWDMNSEVVQPMTWGNVEMSYEVDSLNLLTFSFSSRQTDSRWKQTGWNEARREDHASLYEYGVSERIGMDDGTRELAFNYQRTFENPDHVFTLSYMYNRTPSEGYTNRDVFDFQKADEGVAFSPYNTRNRNKAYTGEHTVQADYVNRFSAAHVLESGIKYIRRNTSSKSFYRERTDSGADWGMQAERVEKLLHVQDIYAAYAAYSFNYKKFRMKLGVRFEQATLDVSLYPDTQPDFDTRFSNLVPSVALSFQAARTRVWKLGYNMRIMRPGVGLLNPYQSETNASVVSYGNSRLKAERFHHVSFGFSSFASKWMVNASLDYRYAGNAIQGYGFVSEEGRVENTYGNIGKENSVALNLFVNCNLKSKTSVRLNGNVAYIDLESKEVPSSACGWQYSVTGMVQQTLGWGIRTMVQGGYIGSRVSLQTDYPGSYYYVLQVNKSFLKDRFTLSLVASNIFDNERKSKGKKIGAGYVQHFGNVMEYSSVQFWLSYRIGNLRAAVKKVKRGIVNDDVLKE